MAVLSADQASQAVLAQPARRSEWLQSWRRFQANRIAVVGSIFIILLILVAIFAPLLAPYDPLLSYEGVRGAPPRRRTRWAMITLAVICSAGSSTAHV